MTSKAALCLHLLKGNVINIGSGFKILGITNTPREIGRSVERAFGVEVSRVHMEGKNRYGCPCVWIDYRLNRVPRNEEGVKKMLAYVHKQLQPEEKEQLNKKQPELF